MLRIQFKSLLIAFALPCLATCPLLAQTPVAFEDSRLEAVIRLLIHKPIGPLTDSDLATVTSLSAPDGNIANLNGLEHATNLEVLQLSGNEISDFTPIAHLRNLRELVIANNPVRALTPLASLAGLRRLDVSWDHLADIEAVSAMTNLSSISVRGNAITTLEPLARLSALTFVNAEENQITNLAPLAGLTNLVYLGLSQNLATHWSILSNLMALESLEMAGNSATNLSFTRSLAQLRYLDISYNQVSDLTPLVGLTNLRSLVLGGNRAFQAPPLSGLTNLTELWAFDCEVTNLSAVQDLLQLQHLDLSKNKIQDLRPLSVLSNLWGLMLSGNPISDFQPLTSLAALTSLALDDDPLGDSGILTNLPFLSTLSVRHARLSNLSSFDNLTNLVDLYAENNLLTNISGLSTLPQLSRVVVTGNLLDTNYDSSAMAVISGLQTRGVGLTFIPQNQPPALSVPVLNVLTNWYVSVGETNFLVFFVSDDISPLNELMVSASSSDQSVVNDASIGLASTNGLFVMAITPRLAKTDLITLRVSEDDTGLKSEVVVPITALHAEPVTIPDSSLQSAILSALGKNEGASLSSVDLLELTSLNLFGGAVYDLTGLQGASNLMSLTLNETSVSDLGPISSLSQLSWLSAANAAIRDPAPLVGLTNLSYLDLGWNVLTNYAVISQCTSLTYLGLGGDAVTDLSFLQALTNLTALNLPANQIADLTPLSGLYKLTSLYVQQNLITNIAVLTNLPLLGLVDVSVNLVNTNLDTVGAEVVQTLTGRGVTLSVEPRRELSLVGLPELWFLATNAITFWPVEVVYNDLYPSELGGFLTSSAPGVLPANHASATIGPDGTWLLAIQGGASTGVTSLTLTVTNADGLRASASVRLTVAPGQTVALPDPNLKAAILSTVGSTNTTVNTTDLLSLTRLDASKAGISNVVGLGFATNLVELRLDNNMLTDISPLKKLPQLVSVSLSNNLVSDILPIQGLPNLAYLDLSDNSITNSEVFSSGFSSLTNLSVAGNALQDLLFLSNLSGLRVLDAGRNSVRALPLLAALTNIANLTLSRNFLTDVSPLLVLPHLAMLDIRENLLDLRPNSQTLSVIFALESHAGVEFEPQRTAPVFDLPTTARVSADATSFLAFHVYENGISLIAGVDLAVASSNTNIVPNENLNLYPEGADDWVLMLTPAPGVTGLTWLTLSVTNDAGIGSTFAFAVSVFEPLPLGSAFFGTTNILWQADPNSPWFGQTNTTLGTIFAAQSGSIPSGGTSSLQASVNGPGLLSFWWKVSSEPDYDWLAFIAGGQTNMISGDVDWQYQEAAIPLGSQNISWIYAKDASCCAAGLDSGWIAGVSFHPGAWLEVLSPPTNGICTLSIHGFPGQAYQLQMSNDLIHWSPLAELWLTNTPSSFQDPGAGGSFRAYRLLGVQ